MSLFETADDRVSVDVWSDVMCPFCLIGDRLLGQAADRAGHPVQVRYHSYQLQPDLPADRTRPVLDMLVDAKRMPREQVEEMDRQITARGAEVGVEFRQDIALAVNTRDAHRLSHVAAEHGLQHAMVQALFRAYFTQGRNVADHEVLADLAAEVGLDRQAALDALASDAHADTVDADVQAARRLGIGGVPFFVVDGKYAISGAQPLEVFERALAAAWADKADAGPAGPADGAAPPAG